jgi:lipoprotein-releasing system permease protein
LLLLVVSIAAFNLGSHFVVSIESRRRDIAILRTLGAERREILMLFLIQGMLHCSLATGFGLVLGLLLLPGFVALLDVVSSVFEIDLFSEYFVHYLPYDYSAMDASWVALSALVVGLVAHIYPAIRASQTSPSIELNHVRI